MPEGDTIARAAATLRTALAGATVRAFRTTSPRITPAAERGLVGSTVTAIESRGKHLLMTFATPGGDPHGVHAVRALGVGAADDGTRHELVLHTHMGMTGSWHLYRPGERWRAPAAAARVVLETDAFVAPCFDPPVVELLRARDVARHPVLQALGPDAIADDFDAAAARARLRDRADEEIAVALLDQRALAGIGNVYKSEVLFIARVSPFARVRELGDLHLDALIEHARRLLRLNRSGALRRTRNAIAQGERLWVYDRAGKPCRRCGTPIALAQQGEQVRLTYWCPSCQGRS